jgi:hypothetical protein
MDLLFTEDLFDYMEEMADQAEMAEYLREYESDIMRRTGWKGCPTAGISDTDIFSGRRAKGVGERVGASRYAGRRASRW